MALSRFQLIQALLGGSVERDATGRLRLVYLKEGIRAELVARRAFARLLRSSAPLNHQIRSKLAELFDPDVTWLEERKIRFSFRGKGKPTDHAAAIHVFGYVNDRKKRGLNHAYAEAAREFGISEDMAKKCWQRYSRLFGLKASRRQRR